MGKFYDVPTQVRFFDPETSRIEAGIAYRDVIICGCCGGTFEINEVQNIEELPWISLKDEILGN